MQEEQSIVGEPLTHEFEESAIIFVSNMFRHADRDDAIERSFYIAVIDQLEFERQSFRRLARELDLFFGNIDPDAADFVVLRSVFEESSEATTEIEEATAAHVGDRRVGNGVVDLGEAAVVAPGGKVPRTIEPQARFFSAGYKAFP